MFDYSLSPAAEIALEAAIDLVRKESAESDLRIFARNGFIYFTAGSRVVAALRVAPNATRVYQPLDQALICLN